MSQLKSSGHISIIHPQPKHFAGIQELCRKVYPFTKPWAIAQLESHRSYFPGGQLIAVDDRTGDVVGLAFCLIIMWDDYSPQDSWSDFTSHGYFRNHDPKKGKTLYGAEVMVDPEMRGQGIGKLLYDGRREIVEKMNLKRIRAGARLRGYSKYKDKLTPQEYTIQVVQKKIYDPTLSFQLSKGFVVIDVAKNYLYDDPESLGYAAVIEWLNPKVATATDFKKQKDSVDAFMANDRFVTEFLPRELHRLVRKVTYFLGEVIRESEGKDFYNGVEKYRQSLKKMRKGLSSERLLKLQTQVKKETPGNQLKIAHAFALQLELVNSCETSYRTWRLRKKPTLQGLKTKTNLTFVLTAHPTEARSAIVVKLLQRLTDLLIEGMNNNFVFGDNELMSLVRLLWSTPLAKAASPSVTDEADYLYSMIFSKNVLDSIISEKSSYHLNLRTWVGGDKDGHPGVNSVVMAKSLTLSRKHVLAVVREKLLLIIQDMDNLPRTPVSKIPRPEELDGLVLELDDLEEIGPGDGNKIKKWLIRFKKLQHKTGTLFSQHHAVLMLNQLIEVFPAFVMPIELREDADQIARAIKGTDAPIWKMLEALDKISGALGITNYARGIVISHCENVHDIMNTCHLVWSAARTKSLPVIPLFESKEALVHGPKIVRDWLKNKSNLEQVKRHWLGYMEIMLGYSDSSKEIGVLASRRLIYRSMFDIEAAMKPFSVKPIFFHGSGGSVARGGGSIKEQISWWSNSAIEKPKITVQGEMIQRNFATKEILNSQCIHFMNEATRRKSQTYKFLPSEILEKFAGEVENKYRELIADRDLSTLLDMTPYRYLNYMKIGSRPAKRVSSELSIGSLRAIPWVLCWTQTRSLLPTWWGVGTAWERMSPHERLRLQQEFKENPFFISFVKMLGFTLAKVELEVWKLYSKGTNKEAFFAAAEKEFKAAKTFLAEITGEKHLIWYRPWLEESIRLRAPHIHILNVLQIEAMGRRDEPLLRETLVGISCGMLTTG